MAAPVVTNDGPFELVAHLRLREERALESLFWSVATPGHPEYLNHQSVGQLRSLVGASASDIQTATAFLKVPALPPFCQLTARLQRWIKFICFHASFP